MESYDVQAETSSLVEEVQSTIHQLQTLWQEIGYSEVEQCEKILTLKETVRRFHKKADHEKNTLLKKIDEKGKEICRLSKGLGVYSDELYTVSGVPLIEMEEKLRKHWHSLKAQVEERKEQLQALLTEEKDLCDQLIEDPTEVPVRDIPTLDEMADLERRIETLNQEKNHRLQSMLSLKRNISDLLKELNQKPSSRFLNTVINQNEELVTLSLHNLEELRSVKRKLEEQAKKNKDELTDLERDVKLLWQRLEIEQNEVDFFIDQLTRSIPKDINLYRAELERLEELKKENISRLVLQLKTELENWWEKCYISDEEMTCDAYSSGESSDAILAELEKEVRKYQDLYLSREHLFVLLEKRKALCNTLSEVENKASDPSRLFKNRGGGLLKEEKMRKRIKAELPRVEDLLKEKVFQWEEEQREEGKMSIFTVNGLTVTDYLEREWQLYHDKKVNLVKQRHDARSAQIQQEARLGASPRKALNKTKANETRRRNTKVLQQHNPTAAPLSNGVVRRVSKRLRDVVVGEAVEESPPKRMKEGDSTTYSVFSDLIGQKSEDEHVRSSIIQTPKRKPPIVTLAPPSSVPRNMKRGAKIITPVTSASKRRNTRQITPNASVRSTLKSPISVSRLSTKKRKSFRNGNSTINRTSSSRNSNGSSTLKLSTPARNKLRFLI